jgi:hypothetical protein
MVKSSVASFFSTYLLTTHKQVGSKNSTYLVITYFLTLFFIPIYLYLRPISYRIGNQGETKILSQLRFIHPQPSNSEHPVDVALVGAGSLWWPIPTYFLISNTPPPQGHNILLYIEYC